MMLLPILRPVQKSATRLLLAGTNSAVDFHDQLPDGLAPAVPSAAHHTPAVPSVVGPPQGPLCLWHTESRWPGGVQPILMQGAEATPAVSADGVAPELVPSSADSGPSPVEGSPSSWPSDAPWPVGAMVWPVLWPPEAVVNGAGSWPVSGNGMVVVANPSLMESHQSHQPQQAHELGLESGSSCCAKAALPGRTGASRRQRRRQRSAVETPEPSLAGKTPIAASVNIQTGECSTQSYEPQKASCGPAQENYGIGPYWPPTPESTPPSSPRHAGEAEPDEYKLLVAQLAGEAGCRPTPFEQIVSSFWPMASTPSGCRVVQKAFEVADTAQQIVLAERLRGHVLEASSSPHANHVLQKCIEVMPPDRVQFMLEEMKGHVVPTARHRYGCRVLERLIENCPCWQTAGLVDEVLVGTPQLCRHTFGNFVVQHILEHGKPDQKERIMDVICGDVQRLARHRVASHVVRSALIHCAADDKQRLVQAMSAEASELADLAHHHCGSFVVRELRRADLSR
mmetsp:Transcript_66551/g.142339  ORF Transcript_66551/g.142339 Transcript_66551/m.142339 type:complete len:511 (-) Transcript_66551:147-1679(-)